MKKIITFCAILLFGCGHQNSLEQLQDLKKPSIVFAKHQYYNNTNVFIVKDADGNFITLHDDRYLDALMDKYKLGDTIQ